MALRKMLVQFSKFVFMLLWNVDLHRPLRILPLRMSSAFPNAGGALEDTRGS